MIDGDDDGGSVDGSDLDAAIAAIVRCCEAELERFEPGAPVETLGRDRDALLDALDRLSRRAEWGVRAFGPRGAMEWEAPRRAIHDKLAEVAEEALLNQPQAVDPGGHPGEMFLSGVYLIADEEASYFRSAVRELAERFDRRGIDIVLTGPRPAYNFVKSSIEAAR